MRSTITRWAVVVLVASFVVAWRAQTDQDVVGPRRQFVITLSGRGELVMGDGTMVAVGPGHINLIEDTTGKGHTTRNIGPEDRIVVTIPLADQGATR